MKRKHSRPSVQGMLPLLPILLGGGALAQNDTAMETVEVVGATPLGAERQLDRIAANARVATADGLRKQRAVDLADFMRRNLASVFVNEVQSNPLQNDVQYRGFVGSPLLGLPQGIAVYQDGVRLNEPFGDTVNWALIPDSAIDTLYLMPGSNPLFGLNALGGSIAIDTKDGFSGAGKRAELYTGSFSRSGLSAEVGGSTQRGLGYFLTAAYLEEDGWRDFSPTEATQVFGKLSRQADRGTLDLSISLADTDLIGNGAAPVELLVMDREAIFTRPDRTENDLRLLNLSVDRDIAAGWSLQANLYFRGSDIDTYNGDDSDFEECLSAPGFICDIENGIEAPVLDENDNPIPIDPATADASINRTRTEQDGSGINLQTTWTADLARNENQLALGFSFDGSDIEFASSTELGALDASRLAVPGGVLVGDAFTRLSAETGHTGFFLTDTYTIGERIALTASGRFNDTNISLRDGLGTALNGDHDFDAFNPALGVTAVVGNALTVYAGYSRSSRAPSPIELTCADENDPCRLPNAFIADPPLEQVVATTAEAGLRGIWASGRWHVGVFRTVSDDDILFISAGALTNQGFFDNVGRTRRDGLELNANGQTTAGLSWFVDYTYLNASFRDAFVVPSRNNPAAVGGEIPVSVGDRLPLIPKQILKAGVELGVGAGFSVGLDALVSAGSHFRGDEGNRSAPLDGYAVVNLRGDYRLDDNIRFFVNVDNLFDRRYETFGLFGEAADVLGNQFLDRRFVGPGPPRAAWVGISLDF